MNQQACWCGSRELTPFGDDYLECVCGTLVRSTMPAGDITCVTDEEHDLYGRNYWFARQAELGLPDIDRRRLSDVKDRVLAWLRLVLAYKSPPGRVLEIGAGHGAFVSLLIAAGFDACGLELSPWLVDYARRTSGAPLRQGPVEAQAFEPHSFDVIVAFDVLEHLADPGRTVRHCARLLRPDGLLILQTPRRSADIVSPDACPAGFRRMLIPEHLYLFSEQSARALLARAGFGGVSTEPPVFDTDMILVAGAYPPQRHGPNGFRPSASLEWLLELDEAWRREAQDRQHRLEVLARTVEAADRDRAAHAEDIRALRSELGGVQGELQTVRSEFADMRERFEEADRDRRERQERIDQLQARHDELQTHYDELQTGYHELEARQHDLQVRHDEVARALGLRQAQNETLEALFAEADRQRTERQARLEGLARELAGARNRLGELEGQLRQAETERTDHVRVAAQLGRVESEMGRLSERYESLRAALVYHRNSRLYKAMVRVGRWQPFETWVSPALEGLPQARTASGRDEIQITWTLPTTAGATGSGPIAVDLTAILPGGENGGAKLVALEVVRALSRRFPDRQFVLLTSAASHHEVAALDAPNVRRHLVDPAPTALADVLEQAAEPVAALFCPMTTSPFDDPRVPVVCLVHDLQYRTYGEFFGDDTREARRAAFEHVVRVADHIVTPSSYVRSSVLQHPGVQADRVTAIGHRFSGTRLGRTPDGESAEILARYGLARRRYFIYPANFWPHKNHLMLLLAFAQVVRQHPDLDLRLVLTGASRPDPRTVRDSISRMRLDGRVLLPGYVPPADLAALLSGALALVFPSLYEGFGMPIVEAFAAGCPVACSDVTSLPEVAGDAALYFDPRKPEAIAAALEQLVCCPSLADDLRRRGLERVRSIDATEPVALDYMRAVDRVCATPRQVRNQLAGVFSDRWTTSALVVACEPGTSEVRMAIDNSRDDGVTLTADGVEPFTLEAGRSLTLRCVPGAAGYFRIAIGPTFRPCDREPSTDTRSLGLRLRSCTLHGSAPEPIDLLSTLARG